MSTKSNGTQGDPKADPVDIDAPVGGIAPTKRDGYSSDKDSQGQEGQENKAAAVAANQQNESVIAGVPKKKQQQALEATIPAEQEEAAVVATTARVEIRQSDEDAADIDNPDAAADFIELLQYSDSDSRTKSHQEKLEQFLTTMARRPPSQPFAIAFLRRDGVPLLLHVFSNSSAGSVQKSLIMQAIKPLLLYQTAIDSLEEQPHFVSEVYAALHDHTVNTDEHERESSLGVARSALELLTVLCSVLHEGHELVHRAAQSKAHQGVDHKCYSTLIELLKQPDVLCARATITFMNVLMSRRKAADRQKGNELLQLWKEVGLLQHVKRCPVLELDVFSTFKRVTDFGEEGVNDQVQQPQ